MSRKRYKITAKTFDKKGRPISIAENNYNKTHPLMLHFASKVNLKDKLYLHAEVLALIRAGDTTVHTLQIERYNTDGTEACAKPCPVCEEAIKAYGVKVVQYTDQSKFVVEYRL